MSEQTNKSEIETIEVHNAATYYALDDDGELADQIIVEYARPQDWGNQQRWHYEFFKLEWVYNNKKYINNCHCWTDYKDPAPKEGYPSFFSHAIASIFIPGRAAEECGRDYLGEDDFWSEEWGKMPPYYDPSEEYEDQEIYD
jgi:hypothetical protein